MTCEKGKDSKNIERGILVVEDCSSDDVARAMIKKGKQDEPFHIFNMDEMYRFVKYFQDMMPKVQIFYVVKCNDHDMVLKLLVSQGCGFSCSSAGEMAKILDLGVNPRSIIFAVPSKKIKHIIFAREAGVKHTTFDSSCELKKLKTHWPDVSLLLRIKVKSDCIYKLDEKFGCDTKSEAVDLLEDAASLGLKVIGVTFHIGSACFSKESYVAGLQYAHTLFEHEARAGRKMTLVDIGGGFLGDSVHKIDEVSKFINKAIEELFLDPSIQIIAEPGRYFTDSAFKEYCNINGIKKVKINNKTINFLYINDGIHGNLIKSETWQSVKKFQVTANDAHSNQQLEESYLFGPSCNSNDRVMKDKVIRLPRCEPFEWLVFSNRGAYTIQFATQFSCLEMPLIRTIISTTLWQKIKDNAVFEPQDFDTNPDISRPLPSSVICVPKKSNVYVLKTPLLHI